MKLAVMQPYFFPYIGYFQMINAVDKFIFYDDVNFIKNGWINRNRILINNEPKYITIQLKGASSFKEIKETEYTDNRKKLMKSILQAYAKAPYFNDVMPVVESALSVDTFNISELAIQTVKECCNYLGINTIFEVSSKLYGASKGLDKAERLKQICQLNNASSYINAIGGTELYYKEDFKLSNINLQFIKPKSISYQQSSDVFHPWLSIIDVLMWNNIEAVNQMLNEYQYE
jgi:hypothetical protein